MTKAKTDSSNTATGNKAASTRTVRKPKAVTLLVYLTDYLTDSNIQIDESIAVVIANLEASIVDEAKAKMRS